MTTQQQRQNLRDQIGKWTTDTKAMVSVEWGFLLSLLDEADELERLRTTLRNITPQNLADFAELMKPHLAFTNPVPQPEKTPTGP